MPGLNRGDLVSIVLPGDFGKPRPALLVQADVFLDEPASFTVCAVTSTLVAAPLLRITVEPDAQNGLKAISQIQIDRLFTVRPDKLGARFGTLDETTLQRVDRSLLLFLGLTR